MSQTFKVRWEVHNMKPLIGVTPQFDQEHNRVKIETAYFKSIRDAGGVPILLPLHNNVSDLIDLVDKLDGVVFTGGPDVNPMYFNEEAIPECGTIVKERDELELPLLTIAMERKLPVLGICRGIQAMNIALGGDIYQDIKAQTNFDVRIAHYQKSKDSTATHKVSITQGTLLSRIVGKSEIWVNSFHHQAVRNVADGLTVAAVASDGLVEAVTKEDYPFFLAVQWHPEELFAQDEYAQKIFNEFIIATRVYNQ